MKNRTLAVVRHVVPIAVLIAGVAMLATACASSQRGAQVSDYGVTVAGVPIARNLGGAIVTVAPHCEIDTCRGMYVVVENRTATPVNIDWPRATFFVNSNPKGSFLGDGENVERTSLTKLGPTTVAPQTSFNAVLSPIVTSTFEETQGWTTGELPMGRIGARFVVRKLGIPHTGMFEYNIVARAKPNTLVHRSGI